MGLSPDWPLDFVPTINDWNYWFSSKVDELPIVKLSPGDGSTLVMGTGLGVLIVDPAGMLNALTIVAPTGALDRQVFRVVTTQDVEALTVEAPGLQSISNGGPWIASAGGGMAWVYLALYGTWYKIQ